MSEKIVQYGKRDNWPGFKSSLGVDLTEEDENILKSFAESAYNQIIFDKVAKKHGTEEIAKAYLDYLYTEEGQEIIAKHYYRPRSEAVAAKYAERFPKINLVTIERFGGWQKAQTDHFADGGIFDKIYQ